MFRTKCNVAQLLYADSIYHCPVVRWWKKRKILDNIRIRTTTSPFPYRYIFKILRMTNLPFASYLSAAYSNWARILKLLWSPGIDSASLCSLAGRNDKKTALFLLGCYFLAPTDFLYINSSTAQDDDFAICFISICCIFKLLNKREMDKPTFISMLLTCHSRTLHAWAKNPNSK